MSLKINAWKTTLISVKQAMADRSSAMQKEMQAIEKKQIWKLLPLLHGKKAILWASVFKFKTSVHTERAQFKAN